MKFWNEDLNKVKSYLDKKKLYVEDLSGTPLTDTTVSTHSVTDILSSIKRLTKVRIGILKYQMTLLETQTEKIDLKLIINQLNKNCEMRNSNNSWLITKQNSFHPYDRIKEPMDKIILDKMKA